MVRLYTRFNYFLLTLILGHLQCYISFGQQVYNSDPYAINFSNLDIEHKRSEVLKYKIKSSSSKKYKIKKHKLKNPNT